MVTGRFCYNSLRPFGAPPSVREALAGEVLRIRRRVGGCWRVLLRPLSLASLGSSPKGRAKVLGVGGADSLGGRWLAGCWGVGGATPYEITNWR